MVEPDYIFKDSGCNGENRSTSGCTAGYLYDDVCANFLWENEEAVLVAKEELGIGEHTKACGNHSVARL